jgi:hypothetical protein
VFSDSPAARRRARARVWPEAWTPELIEAAREVDELAPAAPPISPGIRNQMGPWPEPPPLPEPDLDIFQKVSK